MRLFRKSVDIFTNIGSVDDPPESNTSTKEKIKESLMYDLPIALAIEAKAAASKESFFR